MEKANQIQIALLAVIILMLGWMMFSGTGGSKSSSSVKDAARESLVSKNNNAVANNNTPAATPPVPTGPTTSMKFAENEYDFGNIQEGEKVKHTFSFTNTGKEDLVISNAKGSCGCTVPTWPKEPIPPGETGEIEVQFDSKNKPGKQSKNVTITANTDPVTTTLKISADVAKDPNKPATAAPAAPAIQAVGGN